VASLLSFAHQLERCDQDPAEILAFVEAFAKVRLKGIIAQLAAPPPIAMVVQAEDAIKPEDALEHAEHELAIVANAILEADRESSNHGKAVVRLPAARCFCPTIGCWLRASACRPRP
jgi:hypothetical protein